MAQVIITFPDAVQSRIINSIATRFNYQANIADLANPGTQIPNPETKGQFSIRMIKAQVKDWVVKEETSNAGNTAADIKKVTSDSEIDIT